MFPDNFLYTSGIYPFKRTGEDPTRMFAGEGIQNVPIEDFHYVSAEMPGEKTFYSI